MGVCVLTDIFALRIFSNKLNNFIINNLKF